MQAKIKSLHLENFKGAKNATYQFDGKNVSVMGANATGKTTIADSLWWLLFNKDSQGNEKFSIRPLDKDGKQIDNVEICVSYVFDIEGKETVFEKTQKQNWVKKRGTSESVMQGNVNSYTVDGYPKSEKDYKACVAGISEEELFKILTNPGYLPGLKWDKQRSIILPLAGDISDVELAGQDKRFADLIGELEKAPSTDDIKKKYQKALNEWKKKQAELPVRIDEAEKQKVDIDVADLELLKNSLNEQIAENKAKQENISKKFEEQQKASDGILELQFELNDLQRKANEENNRKRRELDDKITDIQIEIKKASNNALICENNIKSDRGSLEQFQKAIEVEREKYRTVSATEFNENELICPTCKREYEAERQKELRDSFDKNKSEHLEKITSSGNYFKGEIDKCKSNIAENEKQKKEWEDKIFELQKSLKPLVEELEKIPDSIDISDCPEVQEIQRKIAEKEAAMNKGNSAEEIRKQLKGEAEELQKQMDAVKEQFVLVKKNDEADDRIAELREEQRKTAQCVADQERMLYLLEEFIRYKMDSVSETINSQFEMVNFILFRNQINGGLAETCECEYGGVPYASLNSAAKIQCGLDIIRTLQKFHDVYCPVFVDNRESCTEIPKMGCQVISLYVEPSCKELKVEVG